LTLFYATLTIIRMQVQPLNKAPAGIPAPDAILALLKPITWFPPMWAFACGAVAAGPGISERWMYVLAGVFLAGPLVCGTSQAVNDWFDRHVDAINEPDRVIPSGRMPGRWGLYIAITNTLVSLLVASFLGIWVFFATIIGLVFAWAYSAPPFRLKKNGWLGNAAVGFSYESLPWITAAAAAIGAFPGIPTLTIAFLYGLGAHGIMTLNDFKSIEGDQKMGVDSLPVLLGAQNAARLACEIMAGSQLLVIMLLLYWGMPAHALIVATLLSVQIACMVRFLINPSKFAVWYSAIGVGLYVTGMMVSAFAIRAIG